VVRELFNTKTITVDNNQAAMLLGDHTDMDFAQCLVVERFVLLHLTLSSLLCA
jgi:hypothetical protein